MDERRVTGTAGTAGRDTETDGDSLDAVADGDEDRITTVEDWTPSPDARDVGAVRQYLTTGESIQHVAAATHVEDGARPASVGLTDRRLIVVREDGGFVGVGLDRICAVRGDSLTNVEVRGNDYRVLLGAGFLLAIVGFLGVLATAGNPLVPTYALATAGGALATDRVRRTGADLDGILAALDRYDRGSGIADHLREGKRRLNETVDDDSLTLGAASGFTLGTFVLVVGLEGGFVTPIFTLLTVAGAVLAVSAFRYSDAFDGIELVRRRERRVRATIDDGSTLVVRTHPDSTLERELAGLAQGRPTGARAERVDD